MGLPFNPPPVTCDTCCNPFTCSGEAQVLVSGVVMPGYGVCLGGTYTYGAAFTIVSGNVNGIWFNVTYDNYSYDGVGYPLSSVPINYYDDGACTEYDFTDTLYMYLECYTDPQSFTLSIGYPFSAPTVSIADGGSYLFHGTGTYDPSSNSTTITNTLGDGTATITIQAE